MPLFDPLRHLRSMHVKAYLKDGQGFLRFDRRHTRENRAEALAVAKEWREVLRLQLENGGASVQKLIAVGRLRIEEVRKRG